VAVPTNSSSPGVVGQIAYSGDFVYICVATNSWVRFYVDTF
jgi:hypothetical protein